MDAQAMAAVSAAVVALTQLLKWMGINEQRAPLVVMGVSAMGVLLWGFSVGSFVRAQLFDYFSAWVMVSLAAAGVYGFTRSMPSAVGATKEPPPGAGTSRVEEMPDLPKLKSEPSNPPGNPRLESTPVKAHVGRLLFLRSMVRS
jgi:hypothetical protein